MTNEERVVEMRGRNVSAGYANWLADPFTTSLLEKLQARKDKYLNESAKLSYSTDQKTKDQAMLSLTQAFALNTIIQLINENLPS